MADNDHFYAIIAYEGTQNVILVTADGRWQLRHAEAGSDFEKYCGKRGTWSTSWTSDVMLPFVAEGKKEAGFFLTGLKFPPGVTLEPRFFENQFHIGDAWAKDRGYSNADGYILKRGHWYAVATGPLVNWIKQYCEEKTKELKQLALSLGLNLAAMVDPSGTLSFASAVEASTRGDYLGCALNLLGAAPLIGKVAQAMRNSRIAAQIERTIEELSILRRWIEESKTIIQRTGITGGLNATIQGTTKAIKAASVLLRNDGWLTRLDPKDMTRVGFLPKEIEILAQLSKQGYYIAIRACNPARVEWLLWAGKAGVRMIAKPLWIKAKSLKSGSPWSGLVGYAKSEIPAADLVKIAPPPGFNPGWLAKYGGKPTAYYRMAAGKYKDTFEITDATLANEHVLVEVGGELVLCDAKGAGYISDLDVILIQRQLGSGVFGPPSMRVGPSNIPYKGGDNAEVGKFWNSFFEKCGYPPGYKPVQHGEPGGTAGNFMPTTAKFKSGTTGKIIDLKKTPNAPKYDPAMDVRVQVWGPGTTWESEEIVVAAQANKLDGVGLAKSWEQLMQFHKNNPMGEFRWLKGD